ncbi:MAG: thrombospondin type 3 repeat-containing protein [Deltaproteobacteria bacterium]|nr:thrombospondin type 3 repeat-containing protein [Deltaproteobacteria bacterium]
MTNDPASVYPPDMLTLLLLLSAPAQGQGLEIHYQGFASGVSVDASGITTNDDFNLPYEGPSLVVQIPGGAVVEKVYALVLAEKSGWHEDPSPGNWVHIDGKGLGNDTRIASTWRYNLHDLTDTLTITGGTTPQTLKYEEYGDAELRTPVDMDPDPSVEDWHGPQTGHGVAGTTLFVIYNHPTNTVRRHITIATDNIYASSGAHTLTGLPSSSGTMLFAPTIVMECANALSNTIEVADAVITDEAGGRDDGAPGWGCIDEGLIELPDTWYANWHSPITSGSFGFSGTTPGTDVWEGTDGDSPTGEPSGASDELYEISYTGGGSVDIDMYGNTDSWMRAFAMVIEIIVEDVDGDGVLNTYDSDDNDRNVCQDLDGDTCDDCADYSGDDPTGETVDPSDDGPDGDSDGLCDAGDTCYDPDGDNYGTFGYDLSGCTGSTTVADNCPDLANPTQANADLDSLGDACDTCTDSDGDGYGDPGHDISTCTGSTMVYDNCPVNANANQADADGDGTGDVCDTCEDADGDGYADPGKPNSGCVGTGYDNCPDLANGSQTDTDGDGQGDACDLDDDDDTFLDTEEVAMFTDPLDQDTDGDNIAEWDEISDAAAPENTDGDADIDALDEDSDGDTVSDMDEAGDVNIATVPVDTDLDLTPDFRDLDSDNDGILDGTDNCRVVVNAEQENLDGDPYGDACDDDWDGDGVVNDEDNCPLVANPLQEDLEEDGIGDACSDSRVYFQGGACRGNVAGGPSIGWWVVLLLVPAIFRRRTGRG